MNDLEKKLAEKNGLKEELYHQRTVKLIREKYTVNEELSILRQRDTKPEEFSEYSTYVENCKAKAKKEVYNIQGGDSNDAVKELFK